MPETLLSSAEKASLTDFARKLVERGNRSTRGGPVSPSQATADQDAFSTDGLLKRLLAVEERLGAIDRTWKTSFESVLFALERLERKSARTDGEMSGFRDFIEQLEYKRISEKEELLDAVKTIVSDTTASITTMVDRLDQANDAALARPPAERKP